MPRPTTSPLFAESAAVGDVSAPLPAVLSGGWPFGLKPPHEWANWLQRLVGQWLDWLGGGGIGNPYPDPATAYADMADGDFARVWLPGQSYGGTPGATTATGAVTDLDGDGVYVYLLLAATGQRRLRLSPYTVTATYVKTNAGTSHAIASDGQVVVIAYGNYVEAFEPTGASRWVYDHTAAVSDVCIYRGRVYMVGAADGMNRTLKALVVSGGGAGTMDWGYTHNAPLYAVCAGSGRVFIAGAASAYASLSTLRAINAADGTDAAGEGAAADTAGLAWDQVQATPQAAPYSLATDGQTLYCGYPVGAPDGVDARGVGDGAVFATHGLTAEVVCVTVDPCGVMVATNNVGDGNLWSLDRQTLSTQWKSVTSTAVEYNAVWSDGFDVIGGQPSGVARFARGNTAPTVWLRPDHTVTDLDTPWRGLIHPFGR